MEKKLEDKRELGKNVSWNCIVITCSDPKWRTYIERQANQLAKAGLLPSHDILLVVEDPQLSSASTTKDSQPCGVGSGGATINALLTVTEMLCSLAGDTVINSEVLSKNLILVVHFGRSSCHYPGGNAFLPIDPASSWVPPSIQSPVSPVLLQHSIWMSSFLASKSTCGIWVSSLDFFIPFSSSVDVPSTDFLDGALICSLKLNKLLCKSQEYGFLTVDLKGSCQELVFKCVSPNDASLADAKVVSGFCFLSVGLSEKLLSLYTIPPLDRCTYYGIDSSSEPVQISLFLDILLPLCSETNHEKYLSGELGEIYTKKAKYSVQMHQERTRARHNIWNELRPHRAQEHELDVGMVSYLNPVLPFAATLEGVIGHTTTHTDPHNLEVDRPSLGILRCNSRVDCDLKPPAPPSEVTFINCLLGPNLSLKIDGNCVVSDLRLPNLQPVTLTLGSRLLWQRWPLEGEDAVVTCHGFDDRLAVDRKNPAFSIFNQSWGQFAGRMKLAPEDLWDPSDEEQTLLKAKLFPSKLPLTEQASLLGAIVPQANPIHGEELFQNKALIQTWKDSCRKSLENAMKLCDMERLCRGREDTFVALVERLIRETSYCMMAPRLLPSFKYVASISKEKAMVLFDCLHEVLFQLSPTSSRLLANVADLLGCLGGLRGGLRSGPAANLHWIPALKELREGDYRKGIRSLETACKDFVKNGRPSNFIRAARHYERASQILIEKQVETGRNQVFPMQYRVRGGEALPKGVWVEALCPARLDLAGAWTDTPPICYELGGAVLNVAIKVNGKKPIGARARLTDSTNIVCLIRDWTCVELRLVWQDLSDIMDYSNPISPGSLLKACLVYTNFVDLKDNAPSLQDQLSCKYNAGLELVVWSDLRQGSGLGGSSLVSSAVLAVLFVVMGFKPPTTRRLVHATLIIEQMLTTGGGWQDQVGGLVGGLKLGVCRPGIPLVVDVFRLTIDHDFLAFLNRSLLLIYTGKVRLARNLLQTVLRNWYAKDVAMTTSFREMRHIALEAVEAVLAKDGSALGKAIDASWQRKKVVAHGSEPKKVGNLMASLSPFMLGQSMAGAGGGGYMYGLTAESSEESARNLLATFDDMGQDGTEVDLDGLRVSIGGEVVPTDGEDEPPFLTPHVLAHLRDLFCNGCPS